MLYKRMMNTSRLALMPQRSPLAQYAAVPWISAAARLGRIRMIEPGSIAIGEEKARAVRGDRGPGGDCNAQLDAPTSNLQRFRGPVLRTRAASPWRQLVRGRP